MDRSGTLRRLALWAMDVACVLASFWAAVQVRFAEAGVAPAEVRTNRIVYLSLVLLVTFLNYALHINRGFMRRRAVQELGVVVAYVAMLVLGVSFLALVMHAEPMPSRLAMAYFVPIAALVMLLARQALKRVSRRMLSRRGVRTPILVIAEKSQLPELRDRFSVGQAFEVAGWLALDAPAPATGAPATPAAPRVTGDVCGIPVDCAPRDLARTLAAALPDLQVGDVYVSAPHAAKAHLTTLVDAAAQMGAACHVALDLIDPTIQGATLGYFGELPTINYPGRGGRFYTHFLKRVLDVLFSLVVIALMVIPGAILCIVIALQSKGSPFYTQRRVGLHGRHFNLYKFRSMVADASDVQKYFTPEQLAEWERERKVDDDPRITAVGRVLRKTSLDEFPQFVNVLKGEMSVVGPRPIVDEELAHYGDDLDEFLSCKPGVTGWWQVQARNDATYADGSRQQLELYYARHASATLDLNIVLRTFSAVFDGTGK